MENFFFPKQNPKLKTTYFRDAGNRKRVKQNNCS